MTRTGYSVEVGISVGEDVGRCWGLEIQISGGSPVLVLVASVVPDFVLQFPVVQVLVPGSCVG